MKLKAERGATLCVVLFILFTTVSVHAGVTPSKNVTSKPDSLTQGIFLHTSGNSITPVDPVIQSIVEGKRLHANPGEEVKFQNGKTGTWTIHTADSAGWFKGHYLRRGYGLFTIKS
ncbi:MAG TPA: hypothetical protein VKA08_05920, partial [Balneolales bacterium]|nr:hypothetical protein [Balneolales bacterium]